MSRNGDPVPALHVSWFESFFNEYAFVHSIDFIT